MHACICLAHNYPEVLSHCGHGHDLTLVAQLPVVNMIYINHRLSAGAGVRRFVLLKIVRIVQVLSNQRLIHPILHTLYISDIAAPVRHPPYPYLYL